MPWPCTEVEERFNKSLESCDFIPWLLFLISDVSFWMNILQQLCLALNLVVPEIRPQWTRDNEFKMLIKKYEVREWLLGKYDYLIINLKTWLTKFVNALQRLLSYFLQIESFWKVEFTWLMNKKLLSSRS